MDIVLQDIHKTKECIWNKPLKKNINKIDAYKTFYLCY